MYVQTIQGRQRHTTWTGHGWLSLPMSASEQGLHGVPPSHSRRCSRQDMQARSIRDRQRAWFSVFFRGGRLLGWRLLQVLGLDDQKLAHLQNLSKNEAAIVFERSERCGENHPCHECLQSGETWSWGAVSMNVHIHLCAHGI